MSRKYKFHNPDGIYFVSFAGEVVFHNNNVLYESELNYSQASMPEFSPNEIDAEKNITVVWRIE